MIPEIFHSLTDYTLKHWHVKKACFFLHLQSAIALLVMDWILGSINFTLNSFGAVFAPATGGTSIALTLIIGTAISLVCFIIGLFLFTSKQMTMAYDSFWVALLKAFISSIILIIPTPLVSTGIAFLIIWLATKEAPVRGGSYRPQQTVDVPFYDVDVKH
jgi:hypothetical protein